MVPLLGQSDEAINIAGKRVGPAEVESILQSHAGVLESAAVGVPDSVKGEAVWCFWVAADARVPDISAELSDVVAASLGRPFKPGRVLQVAALPKTRSAKVLRRAARAAALDQDAGDRWTLENQQRWKPSGRRPVNDEPRRRTLRRAVIG